MATNRDRDIEIDPRFFVPPGVHDIRQENKQNSEYSYDYQTQAVDGPVLEFPDSVVPMPSGNYQIVEQRVRMTTDGRLVVDVIVDFPDVADIYSVEVSVTKV